MQHINFTFPNGRGQQLAGRIDLPATTDPVGFALYAHCFTCTKSLRAVGRITEHLTQHGIATLRFDFTGLGQSEGDFSATNFSTTVEDLIAAANYLEREHGPAEILIGHSLGGTATLVAAGAIEAAKAVVTIAAPADPVHIRSHLTDDIEAIKAAGEAVVTLAGRPFTIRQQFLEDIANVPMSGAVANLQLPLLVLHAPTDLTVSVDNAATIFGHAKHPKSFISLHGADHLISRDEDARYVAEMIASWASRFTREGLASHTESTTTTDGQESVTVVHIEDGLKVDITTNGFPIVADEPLSVGGTNTGPTPYDLLLSALGACTAMTLRLYSNKKSWPLESVTVQLTHAKVHARDCEECESSTGFIDHITKKIKIQGDLDSAQLDRLLSIADRCPVHRTLHNQVLIKSELVSDFMATDTGPT